VPGTNTPLKVTYRLRNKNTGQIYESSYDAGDVLAVGLVVGQALSGLRNCARAATEAPIGSTGEAVTGATKPVTRRPIDVTQPRRNFAPRYDSFGNGADAFPAKDGYFDVIAHGTPNAVEVIYDGRVISVDHRTLANLIRRSPNYHGQPVRLISCNTGSTCDGLAKNLANQMGVEVLAPNNKVFPAMYDGEILVTDGKLATRPGYEYPVLPPTGSMNGFVPGRN